MWIPFELADAQATPKAVHGDRRFVILSLFLPFLPLILIIPFGFFRGFHHKHQGFLQCHFIFGSVQGVMAQSQLNLAGETEDTYC